MGVRSKLANNLELSSSERIEVISTFEAEMVGECSTDSATFVANVMSKPTICHCLDMVGHCEYTGEMVFCFRFSATKAKWCSEVRI